MVSQGRILWSSSRGHGLRPLHPALALYLPGGPAMLSGSASAPFVSVNYGAAGIAYAVYRLARSRDDQQLLAQASSWVQKGFALSSHPKAFYDPDLEITPQTVGEISLFHSISGLHCVDALVRIATGDVDAAAGAIEAFVAASRGPCDSPDLTGGAAGLLLGCAEIIESAGACSQLDLKSVRNRGDQIADALSEILCVEQIATSTRIRFLGIAHGWAGLVFALLRWTRATRQDVPSLLAAKLDELAELAIPYEDGVCWTMRSSSNSLMPGWCHGTAGYTMLFALAHEVLGTQAYADLAQRAAVSAWNLETEHASLCCGNGGNGYAFLAVYRLTRARVWFERARVAAQRALGSASTDLFRDSLYKGTLGAALLESELDRPDKAAMPLFEPVRFDIKVMR